MLNFVATWRRRSAFKKKKGNAKCRDVRGDLRVERNSDKYIILLLLSVLTARAEGATKRISARLRSQEERRKCILVLSISVLGLCAKSERERERKCEGKE